MLPADILGAGLRAVPRQGDPPHGGPPRRGRGQAGGEEGRRRLLHAHLHRRLHRQAAPSATARGQDSQAGRRPAHPRPRLRSGSFLIGAYQYLLDWHRDWYVATWPEEAPQGAVPGPTAASGGSRAAEKKRILLNNIYGVDIDPRPSRRPNSACCSRCSRARPGNDQCDAAQSPHERALPDLARQHQIAATHYIAPDFYDERRPGPFLDEEPATEVGQASTGGQFRRS